MRLSNLPLMVLALGSWAAPTENTGSKLEERCEWNDGHGPIHCDFFSIVFGGKGRGRVQFVLKANNFEQQESNKCPPFESHRFQSYHSPLPYVVMVAPGNACSSASPEGFWDNLHIKYGSTFLNIPTDTRCGPVDDGWGRRCIIHQRP
ncbi:hypothetical protein FNYG_09884 [Fusarium nygamai]|uniref:Uncharacterized protein n=1 Tax=Gibberella nygamai TaxID=42673 RepID=A0A2K0W3D6_GIBNY|nr:hypothetical protein FNYG_09884 [Fusarium nygamai]